MTSVKTKIDHDMDSMRLRFLDLSKLKLVEINIKIIKLHALIAMNSGDTLYPLSNILQTDLSQLEYLNLDDNLLTSLPPNLFNELPSLKTISIRRNQLTTIPNTIFHYLSKLEKLHLDNNELESIPAGIFKNLHDLRVLSLTSNRLVSLPLGIFSSLGKLSRLYLNHNLLELLPDKLFHNLENLKLLFMKDNNLSKLNKDLFEKMFGLQRLNMIDNGITVLPDGIFKSQINLRVLFIDIDKIKHLPGSLAVCKNLETLSQKFDENDYSFIRESLKAKSPQYLTGDHYLFIETKEEITEYKRKISIFDGDIFCIHCGYENFAGDKDCTKCSRKLIYY